MAIDRLKIFNKVNFFLREENSFFTSNEIHQTIGVDAQRRISEDIDFPKTNVSIFMTSGVYTVSMSSNFIKVDATSNPTFEDKNGIIDLEDARKTNIGRANILKATATATPSQYFMENESTVGIFGRSTSGCIVVPYVKAATSLSSDTDTNEITENTYMAAVYWTLSEMFGKDNDQDRAAKYVTLYDKEINRLEGRYGEMYEIDKDLSPDVRYL